MTLPWWPLVEEQAAAQTQIWTSSLGALVEEALPSLQLKLAGLVHVAKVGSAGGIFAVLWL
jgi:hypothetical protein